MANHAILGFRGFSTGVLFSNGDKFPMGRVNETPGEQGRSIGVSFFQLIRRSTKPCIFTRGVEQSFAAGLCKIQENARDVHIYFIDGFQVFRARICNTRPFEAVAKMKFLRKEKGNK